MYGFGVASRNALILCLAPYDLDECWGVFQVLAGIHDLQRDTFIHMLVALAQAGHFEDALQVYQMMKV
jgi:pentatricopeptide repeat protein